ncbi:hypothetical protein MYX78_01920 [Acidobacteria bacterium AH-259-G07]|nr:hypothetical protein [Acidobacteria bacterium AH-259-G07]
MRHFKCPFLCCLLILTAAGCLVLTSAPNLAADLNLFVEHYDTLSKGYDPITLTSSERIHGWMSGDGLLAYLFVYEATGETRYLESFIQHADRLLSLRDVERGLPDHRGLYLPAWRTEDTYLSGQVILKNAAGEPTLSFLTPALYQWRGKKTPGLGSHVLRVEHLDRTRFNLTFLRDAGSSHEKAFHWNNLTMETEGANGGHYAPTQFEPHEVKGWRRQYSLFDLGAAGTAAERIPVEEEFEMVEGRYPRITNTGTSCFPLAYFARLVKESETLRRKGNFDKKAEQYIEAVELAVAVHDDEWRENQEGEGWYVARRSAPQWSAGLDLPINQSNVLGLAMLELGRISGDPLYRDRVTKLARAFKNNMDYIGETEAYLWPYWLKEGKVGSTGSQEPEDIGHAGPNVLFAYRCYENGIVFSRTDMQRIANTWVKYVIRPEHRIAATIGGQGEGSPDEQWRFLLLALFDRRVYDFARTWALGEGGNWLSRKVESAPVDPEARQKSLRHRMRLTWATLAWVAKSNLKPKY